jgi:hypothetical protein
MQSDQSLPLEGEQRINNLNGETEEFRHGVWVVVEKGSSCQTKEKEKYKNNYLYLLRYLQNFFIGSNPIYRTMRKFYK